MKKWTVEEVKDFMERKEEFMKKIEEEGWLESDRETLEITLDHLINEVTDLIANFYDSKYEEEKEAKKAQNEEVIPDVIDKELKIVGYNQTWSRGIKDFNCRVIAIVFNALKNEENKILNGLKETWDLEDLDEWDH